MSEWTRYRVLVRVIRVAPTWIKVCVPGWNSRSFFRVPRKSLPKYKFVRGYRFHAHASKAAETVKELQLGGPFEEGNANVPSWADLVMRGIVHDPLHLVTRKATP